VLKTSALVMAIFLGHFFITSCAEKDSPITPIPTTPPISTVTALSDVTIQMTNGWVQVSETIFDLMFSCYLTGVGDVVAIGVGQHPDSGSPVEVLIQGLLGRPYVGVTIDKEITFEAALDELLEIYLHDNRITSGAIRWQKNLNLDSGEFDEAGYGSVFVECLDYLPGLPNGY
tara:strand:+ start:1940 stop:2458 length:519 start_codon:yes stop_codon:yes gene_type:complete